MARRVRFRAILEPTANGAFVALPEEAIEALDARRRTSVIASIDGVPYVGQVMPYAFEGHGTRVILGITRAIRAQTGKDAGEELEIELERDDRSRSADARVPPELSEALADDAVAAEAWDRLAPSRRREHSRHVAEAKREATRRRRAAGVAEQLRRGT